ncbi:MAG: hypothetical protein K0S47_3387 [Herbinix sp.]|jgi:hypothetical protein|nr:hypothetical protein [Herbinix sp.]
MIKKIILVFKTHFDIGFTDLSSKVIDKYADSMLKEVIATCKATEHMGRQQYVWTMPSWPLKVIRERCDADLKVELDRLINRGQIVWHALPFTSHTDFCSAEEYLEGLRFGRELSEVYHKPNTITAKMTDVPGHGIMLPAILSGAGVKFLHLGCNEFANPPKLPFLFHWQAVSGERVLTMYSKGGYGTSLLPHEDWNYPVWMALMQTADNCGPQSAEMIEKMVQKIHKKYPDAEVVCSSMDEFYQDLSQYDLSDLPVIQKDLADTWIHGIGAYPKESAMIREQREASRRLQVLATKKTMEDVPVDPMFEDNLNSYYENICLFEEHTWGADVKTWLGPDRVYKKSEFAKAKENKKYKFMEESWQEQKERAAGSNSKLRELKVMIEDKMDESYIFNPNTSEYTGWVSLKNSSIDMSNCSLEINGEILPITKIDGDWACYVKNLPSFITTPLRKVNQVPLAQNISTRFENDNVIIENHRYRLTFSKTNGCISELFDKKLMKVLLKEYNNKSVFAYQYDRYGIEEITTYLREYAYRYSTWGIQDYGREAYPECDHKTYAPTFKEYVIDSNTVTFKFESMESVEWYGDAKEITLEVTLPPVGDEIYVNLRLKNKQECPYVESGTLLFPFAKNLDQYYVNKSNAVLNVATDIQEDANHVFYCLENFIYGTDEDHGLCIITKDSPLVSLGNTGIYKYMRDYKAPEEPIAYFNLFNNMWGTNFPQWIGGDFTYRYILFGFEEKQKDTLMERSVMLQEGVEVTGNCLSKSVVTFPEHMQLMNARKTEHGIVLRFRDLLGKEALRKLQVDGYQITPVNLHNIKIAESTKNSYEFQVNAHGIYSFLLSK